MNSQLSQPVHRKNEPLRYTYLALTILIALGAQTHHALAQGFPPVFALRDLTQTDGFRVDGEAIDEASGEWVGAGGDINGDGVDDVIVGTRFTTHNGIGSGSAYVVFGSSQSVPLRRRLSDLDGTNGFRIDGPSPGYSLGVSPSIVGDINGDGLDDLAVGARRASINGTNSGSVYVIFGRLTPFPANLALSGLDGSVGFRIDGETEDDFAGSAVHAAGDLNDDGIDDLIIGAPGAEFSDVGSGSAYVIFGQLAPFPAMTSLADLNGVNGFRMDGGLRDFAGSAAIGAGDLNGDDIDDIAVGAPDGEAVAGNTPGSVYVVLGKREPFPAIMNLRELDGASGFRIVGSEQRQYTGEDLGAADVNGDGLSDLVISAEGAVQSNGYAGTSYVVFGKHSPFEPTVSVASLDGSNGFRINGASLGDYFGRSVSASSDLNGDGIGDIIVGAPNAANFRGSTYVIFGSREAFPAVISSMDLDGRNGFRIDAEGDVGGERMGWSVAGASDVNRDGLGDLILSAPTASRWPSGGAPRSVGNTYVLYGRPGDALFSAGFE